MTLIYIFNIILTSILVGFLILPFLINLISSITRRPDQQTYSQQKDFACVITAYKNLDLALYAADSLLKQDYDNFHVYIIADECEELNSSHNHSKLTILRPQKKLGSKVRSIHYAINNLIRDHHAIAIFDPDNLADQAFLKECNSFLTSGYKAVQGKRVAKNLDTNVACLDAMGEIYYNYITKEVPYNLGASSIIAGSGMVIETALFKDFFSFPYIKENFNRVIPGEDKILHYYIVSKGDIIAFSPNAIVYDEKIGSAEMIKNQRARWINSYIINLSNAFSLLLSGVISFNFNKFLSGILTIYPPLFLLVVTSLTFIVINIFISWTNAVVLTIACVVFVLNFVLVLKINKASPKIWKAFWQIPYFMFNQILALSNIRKSNKDFLTTQNKKKISVENIIKDP